MERYNKLCFLSKAHKFAWGYRFNVYAEEGLYQISQELYQDRGSFSLSSSSILINAIKIKPIIDSKRSSNSILN